MRWVLALLCIGACGSPPPRSATAVINATPGSICQGRETVVEIDSSGSAGHLTLVPAPPDLAEYPLDITWSFPGFALATCSSGAAPPCIEGVDRSHEQLVKPGDVSTIAIRSPGDRPLHVSLRVTNAKGGVGDALVTVPLTLGDCP